MRETFNNQKVRVVGRGWTSMSYGTSPATRASPGSTPHCATPSPRCAAPWARCIPRCSPRWGSPPRCEIWHSVTNSAGVQLRVADNGVGFDPEILARRVSEGHIGLASLLVGVEARGGSVDVDARPGGGTTITVTVPDGAPALR